MLKKNRETNLCDRHLLNDVVNHVKVRYFLIIGIWVEKTLVIRLGLILSQTGACSLVVGHLEGYVKQMVSAL